MKSDLMFSTSVVDSLVRQRPRLMARKAKLLFVTISPNANTKHYVYREGNRRKVVIPYGRLTQKEQYDYCINAFKVMYLRDLENPCYVGTWELNKSSNVHLHIIIAADNIKNDYELKIFQRDIANHEITMKNYSQKVSQTRLKLPDIMNHIVFSTKPIEHHIEYFDKDHKNKKTLMRSKKIYNFASFIGTDKDQEDDKTEDSDTSEESDNESEESGIDIRDLMTQFRTLNKFDWEG